MNNEEKRQIAKALLKAAEALEASIPAAKLERIRRKAIDILDSSYMIEWREDDSYSGRGMYGDVSPLAFRTDVSPNSEEGDKLDKLGFWYDSMGRGWVYYIK